MNKSRALERFSSYVANYDPNNPRIALKIAHTYRVAELCERIAPSDSDLAWLCGLLHDIGRFEQVRRFDTFNDAVSVSHADLGVDVLFSAKDDSEPFIHEFYGNTRDYDAIRTAIATHSDYRIPQGLDDRTRMLCNVLRDADKIDILKVNCVCPIEDIYGVTSDDMAASELSDEVVTTFYEHRTIPRGIRSYPADILVGHLCFAWELVYPQSVSIMREQGYLDQMLDRTFSNQKTQATFAAMAVHMREQLYT